jgi:hypothetical protein
MLSLITRSATLTLTTFAPTGLSTVRLMLRVVPAVVPSTHRAGNPRGLGALAGFAVAADRSRGEPHRRGDVSVAARHLPLSAVCPSEHTIETSSSPRPNRLDNSLPMAIGRALKHAPGGPPPGGWGILVMAGCWLHSLGLDSPPRAAYIPACV